MRTTCQVSLLSDLPLLSYKPSALTYKRPRHRFAVCNKNRDSTHSSICNKGDRPNAIEIYIRTVIYIGPYRAMIAIALGQSSFNTSHQLIEKRVTVRLFSLADLQKLNSRLGQILQSPSC